jgi:hypothetical protein
MAEVQKKFKKKVQKKVRKKSSKKCLKKSLLKKFENITNCRRDRREGGEGGELSFQCLRPSTSLRGRGGRRIVIPMPEAINFVDGRRQKLFLGLMISLKAVLTMPLNQRIHLRMN